MNKKTYIKPAVTVIDVKVESAFMQFSTNKPGFEGQNPGNNSEWGDGFETKGESNFWDEW